jgi:hypothetical protein
MRRDGSRQSVVLVPQESPDFCERKTNPWQLVINQVHGDVKCELLFFHLTPIANLFIQCRTTGKMVG